MSKYKLLKFVFLFLIFLASSFIYPVLINRLQHSPCCKACPVWMCLIRARADTAGVKRFMCRDMVEKTKWLQVWEVRVSVFRKVRWESLRDTFPHTRGYSTCWGQSRCCPLFFKEGRRALSASTKHSATPQKNEPERLLRMTDCKDMCKKMCVLNVFRSPKFYIWSKPTREQTPPCWI